MRWVAHTEQYLLLNTVFYSRFPKRFIGQGIAQWSHGYGCQWRFPSFAIKATPDRRQRICPIARSTYSQIYRLCEVICLPQVCVLDQTIYNTCNTELSADAIAIFVCLRFLFLLLRMSKPAADIIQKFYLRLRDRSTSADSTPITARQLESLVRLAEARARVDLREEITAQDALVSFAKFSN